MNADEPHRRADGLFKKVQRRPLSVPLSKAQGATPTSAATCLRLMRPEFRQQRNQRAGQYCADSWPRREQAIAVDECIIGGNDLDHALVEQVDVGCEANNAAARKTLHHRIFQQSSGILGGTSMDCCGLLGDEPAGSATPFCVTALDA
jgi:hypothetical protein